MSARRSIRSSVAVLAAWVCAVALLVAAPVALSSSIAPAPAAAAASGSDFNPGNIISDAAFYDSNAMGSSEIQAFMERQVRSCSSGYTCLKDYRQNTDNRPSDRYCNGYEGRGNESASTIIDRVARSCGISQKVILVLLEKEQSLVTSPSPTARAYAAATGQGCPDTAPCDSATLGFFYQVYYAARQYKIYKAFPQDFGYQAGRWNNILYHPYNNCGTQRVYIENQATAGLYIYTPYVPNQAALNNLYGTGDTCSSYGNRNFWRLYTDWFGSTQADNESPFGGFNVEVSRGIVGIRGWALDPSDPRAALTVVVTANGARLGEFRADDPRPDVAAAHPGYGPNHGMRADFEVVGGTTEICVTVRNVGRGSDTAFECQTVEVETASPYGGTTVEALSGGVRITGWTLDTDTRDPLDIHVYIDGQGSVHKADRPRPDVAAVFPGFGPNHGIDVSIQTPVGSHQVCTYGINVGLGMNKLLGCQTVQVTRSADPQGMVDDLYPVPGGFRVRGWAVDPNTTEPMTVHVYRGSSGRAIQTSVIRDDVLKIYPSANRRSGFDEFISAPAGSSTVCVYGINVGWGQNSTLGCRNLEVRAGQAFGGIDTTVTGESVRMRGWAIDPDTRDSLTIHTYIDGTAVVGRADVTRADIARAYPGYGADHGIDETFELDPGTHRICAYAINVGPGTNQLLGCESLVVENHSPFGGTDVTVEAGGVRLRGWTIDPDTSASLQVHVYVDGAGFAVATAAVARPDVARAYPGFGDAHGIDLRLALKPGRHQVCSYAINQGPGSNSTLGCHSVLVP
ncbi:hypothetical protein C1N74_12205 [Microbacterium sp. SGAir0570]|uniref:hypothetical protein n=2 Tax=unclassified Microbacterium TaxID=2609290 RepID=UPI000CDCFDF7|nr:hypothetical protein [Microbacterium sp. SGAir0570]POX65827.1 hypothetical protein C3481_14855 [Microbacterium sp. Ru50]QCR41091.1 hypothetical protein C1N74_12205 [Microbacterium sp. SGAir0570]